MKSIWNLEDWFWYYVERINAWRIRLCIDAHMLKLRFWVWYFTHVPDCVTLELCALFLICVAFGFCVVGLCLFGFWHLVY